MPAEQQTCVLNNRYSYMWLNNHWRNFTCKHVYFSWTQKAVHLYKVLQTVCNLHLHGNWTVGDYTATWHYGMVCSELN